MEVCINECINGGYRRIGFRGLSGKGIRFFILNKLSPF